MARGNLYEHGCALETELNKRMTLSRSVSAVFLAMLLWVPIADLQALELEPVANGPYPVANTNFEMAAEFTAFSDKEIDSWLNGHIDKTGKPVFFTEYLAYPDDAWLINVQVPDELEVYGAISGKTFPVAMFLTYPTSAGNRSTDYTFPFAGSDDTEMQHMQGPGEKPVFAEENTRYPLVFLSHGRNVHGIWSISQARRLASHGYIAVTAHYGDLRIRDAERDRLDVLFRPLAAKAILDHVLNSQDFGSHIDHARIATSGHSMGGFTSLALAGGRYLENSESFHDPRVSAVVAAAPWVGGAAILGFNKYFLFGENNSGLAKITAPVLVVYGTLDEATPSSTILPALEQLSGPRFVIELVDQPHIFEGGSWMDLARWELLFLEAYLKGDTESLRLIRKAASVKDGNLDRQHFELQRLR